MRKFANLPLTRKVARRSRDGRREKTVFGYPSAFFSRTGKIIDNLSYIFAHSLKITVNI